MSARWAIADACRQLDVALRAAVGPLGRGRDAAAQVQALEGDPSLARKLGEIAEALARLRNDVAATESVVRFQNKVAKRGQR